MNLLKETKEVLAAHGLTFDDVEWVGSLNATIPIEKFLSLADQEYNNDIGATKVALDLIVVGKGWWLEREENHGAEMWVFRTCPPKPDKVIDVKSVIAYPQDIGWISLEDYKV